MSPADFDPDANLVQLAGQGDAVACTRLVDRHLVRIHRFAQRLLGNAADAEEVAQEVFLKVWQQAARWRPGAALFSTWLYRVTQNLCLDRLRQRHPEGPGMLEELIDPDAPMQSRLEQASTVAQVRDAVALLPPRQRAAIALCHDEGLSNIAAAAVLEVSVDALESLLARARRSLREWLLPVHQGH